jgi:hypothetical protein
MVDASVPRQAILLWLRPWTTGGAGHPWAQAPQPGRVTIGPGEDDAHGRQPGPRTERLPGRIQRARPHTLQQVAHLQDLADRLRERRPASR